MAEKFKHFAVDMLAVITPVGVDTAVVTVAALDHWTSIALHIITAVCTILVTIYTITKKSK